MNCLICLKTVKEKEKHEGYHDKCLRKLFGTIDVDPILSFSRAQFFEDKSQEFTKNISISGVQPKLAIKCVNKKIEVTEKEFTHILKPSPEEYPEIAQVEHLTMKISKLVGIDTAENGLIRFADGQLVYVTKRFGYMKKSDILVHQEDMMQAMGIHPELTSNAKYDGKSYEEVALFLKQHSGLPIASNFFSRVFFNFMVSNDDFHLKNISIQFDNKFPGNIRLSPHYDSVVTKTYIEGDKELACKLFSKEDGYSKYYNILGYHSKYCFDELARSINIPEKVRDKAYKSYFSKYDQVIDLVDASYVGAERKEKIKGELNERKKKFYKEIPKRYLPN